MRRSLLISFIVTFAFALQTGAQTQGTGLYSFGSFDSKGFDSINLGNLNLHFSIPVLHKPGRGLPINYDLIYDGLVWSNISTGGVNSWQLVQGNGFSATSLVSPAGSLSFSTTISGSTDEYHDFIYTDSMGTPHGFSLYIFYDLSKSPDDPPTVLGSGTTVDNSGYIITYTSSGYMVSAPNGTSIGPFAVDANEEILTPPNQVQDINGNTITAHTDGTITDTLGVTALTFGGQGTASSPRVISYPLGNSASAGVAITYKTYTVQTSFGCPGISEYGATSVDLVDYIEVPGQYGTYHFQYELTPNASPGSYGPPVTGRLASITLPSGGAITYGYSGGCNGINTDGTPAVLTRTTSDGTKTYAHTLGSNGFSTTATTDELQNQSQFSFVNNANSNQWFELERQVWQGIAGGTPLQQRITSYNGQDPNNPSQLTIPISKVTVLEAFNGGSQTKTVTDYTGSELTDSTLIDPSSGSTLEVLQNSYTTLGGVQSSAVLDGSGNTVTQTTYGYDETPAIQTSNIPQHTIASSSLGNLTSIHQSTGTGTITTTIVNYDTGQPYTSTGPNGTTTYGYDSAQGFSTTTTLPTPSSGVSLQTTAAFDPVTGVQYSYAGTNGGGWVISAMDQAFTPTAIWTTDGGETTVTPGATTVSTSTMMDGSHSAASTTYLDSYGRAVRHSATSSPGLITEDTCYDARGNIQYVSTPYAGQYPGGPPHCSASVGTQYSYDALGRVIGISFPDGTSETVTYQSRAVETVTSLGVGTIVQHDSLGRVSGVCELSSSALSGSGVPGSCGMDIAGTGYVTSYAYDLPNHKTTITQGSQQRVFQTDALGRPTYTSEPERGITTYTYSYNSTGLIVTRTRPAPNQPSGSATAVTTTQADSVGRPISVSYADYTNGTYVQPDPYTPSKYFQYDQQSSPNYVGYNKGMLTTATTANTGWVLGYDKMGRPSNTSQCFPGRCGNTALNIDSGYTYDFVGDIVWESDPFLSTGYSYSFPGQISSITNFLNSGPPESDNGAILFNVSNGPNGPVSYQFGNGLDGAMSYDSLGRAAGKWVCLNSIQPNCSGGSMVYGTSASLQGSQVSSMTDSVLGTSVTLGYDEFDRLKSYTAANGNSFDWTYDRYGNRLEQNVTGGSGPYQSISVNPSTNQLAPVTYDAAGNVTNDGSHQYTYDAEGNVVAVDGGSTAAYVYDALNNRVQVSANGLVTQYAYGPFGRASAWDGLNCDLAHLYNYTYWNGMPIAVSDGTQMYFQHQDLLGTERMRTASDGSVVGTYQSLPYGDGFTGSGADYNPYHFAGLDRDSESGTEHAQFRQYTAMSGRWMSPDPYNGSYDPLNPQSLNRYSYALNSPVARADPSGLDYCLDATGLVVENVYTNYDCARVTGNTGSWNFGNPPGSDLPPPGTMYPSANNQYCYSADATTTAPPIWTLGILQPIGPGVPIDPGIAIGTDSMYAIGGVGSGPATPNYRKGCSVLDPNCKKPGPVANYLTFLACEYSDMIEQVTDQEDGQGTNSPSATPAAKLTTIPLLAYGIFGPTKPWVKVTSTVTLSTIMIGTAAHANEVCSPSFFGH